MMKLTKLTQAQSADQGREWQCLKMDTAIYKCGNYRVHSDGYGDWSIYKGGSYTKREINGEKLWSIDLHLHDAELVFPRLGQSAKLSDCRVWLKENENDLKNRT